MPVMASTRRTRNRPGTRNRRPGAITTRTGTSTTGDALSRTGSACRRGSGGAGDAPVAVQGPDGGGAQRADRRQGELWQGGQAEVTPASRWLVLSGPSSARTLRV